MQILHKKLEIESIIRQTTTKNTGHRLVFSLAIDSYACLVEIPEKWGL
jgi:hypothetical protein